MGVYLNHRRDHEDAHQVVLDTVEGTFNVEVRVCGEYHPATWGWNGVFPEEYPAVKVLSIQGEHENLYTLEELATLLESTPEKVEDLIMELLPDLLEEDAPF